MTFLPPPPHIHRIVPDDVGLQVRELPCPPIRCLRCGSCASGQKFACSFLQIPPRDGHPCCSARSSRHQVSKGLSPSSHFPVGFRLPVASARHGAARHAWRTRGRDAGCPAPPAQIRTCALTHTAPTFGSDRGPRGDRRIRSAACVTVPRLGVRPVLWPRGFPSVTGLGSSISAAARYRLVRCLHRYYAGVRLLRAFHHRLTASRLPDAVLPVAR